MYVCRFAILTMCLAGLMLNTEDVNTYFAKKKKNGEKNLKEFCLLSLSWGNSVYLIVLCGL